MTVYSSLLGREPAQVYTPESVSELSTSIQEAVALGNAVVPWGGGSGQDYGYLPESERLAVVHTAGLSRILAIEPGDLTITVESGISITALQTALAPHGLFLPVDPYNPETATIGGVLATNAFSASRLGYGTARDWLIGVSVANPSGTIVKGGGKVVKNVTGYDIPKMHIGALGTLGLIVEATFKLAPLPEVTRTVIISLLAGHITLSAPFLARVLLETTPVQAYLRSEESGDYIVFLYQGFEEVVTEQIEMVRSSAQFLLANEASLQILGDKLELQDNPVPVVKLRITGEPARDIERHIDAIAQALVPDSMGYVHTWLGTGVTDIGWDRDALVITQQTVNTLRSQGHTFGTVYLHASLELRQQIFPRASIPIWHPDPQSLPLMRRLKESLDPGKVFNPGRFVGKI